MRALDILSQSNDSRFFKLGELLQRARLSRAKWTDIPDSPGIYVVFWPSDEPLVFLESAGQATSAQVIDPLVLQRKWECILSHAPTDIIYIGKARNLRERIRALARFGVGKAKNHHGGEWMWQIQRIENSCVLVQTCLAGEEDAKEGQLLKQFAEQHHQWPLANRQGTGSKQQQSPC